MALTQQTSGVKLVRHGDGLALVFDPALLRQFGIEENTPVSVTTDGQNVRIALAIDPNRREKFEAAKQDTFQKYDSVLKRLAE